MSDSFPHTYDDIDWARLRKNALDAKGWQDKNAEQWDAKATSFAKRNKSSTYIDLFLARLPLQPSMTVLDIGSGPGTLALPIAKRVKHIFAVDFSTEMLKILDGLATEQHIDNITTTQCAWEDDWTEKSILPQDIVIASRSMGVKNLEAALHKLHTFAKKYVFLSDRIGETPFDVGAFKAVNRPFSAGPDYIYTLNTLYTMGIHANVTILELEQEIKYESMDEAVASFRWMFNDISSKELDALGRYIESIIVQRDDKHITIRKNSPPRWALIWWKK